jgi:hypothetical protein
MLAIGGMGEIIEAWPGASKEGVVVDEVIPHPLVSEPNQCQTLTDGGVTAAMVHG